MTQRRFITMVSEDTPFELEIVTLWERHVELNDLTWLECCVCEARQLRLHIRGYTYEHETGTVMCLRCLFDSNTNWELIAPTACADELASAGTSKHSRKNF